MQGKYGVLPIAVIGVIITTFSIIVFFLLDFERVAVHWWALTFLLISEILLFAGLIGLKYVKAVHSRHFLKLGISMSLTLYFVFTLISVFLSGLFKDDLNYFILIQLAFITIAAIVVIFLSTFSKRLERQCKEDVMKSGANEPKRGGF